MPRPKRLPLLPIALAALTLVFLASLRWAFVISPGPAVRVGLIAGGLWFQLAGTPPFKSPFASAPMRPPPYLAHRTIYIYRHGFSFQWWFDHNTLLAQSWSIPLWPTLAAAGGWWTWKQARRRWGGKPWQCAECGYDLRGLKDPVCPECGQSKPSTS